MRTEKCTICLGPVFLDDGPEINQDLPCAHLFHKACIQEWADTRNVTLELSCPNCKNDVLPPFVFEDEDRGQASGSGGTRPEDEVLGPQAPAEAAMTDAEAAALAVAQDAARSLT